MNAPKPNGPPHPFLPTHEHLQSCDACIATHRELWAKHFGPEIDWSELRVWIVERVYREHKHADLVSRVQFAAPSEQAAIDNIALIADGPLQISRRSEIDTFVETDNPDVWWRITSVGVRSALPERHSP